VVANLAAFGLFFPSLLVFSGSPVGSTALLVASSGSLLAVAGATLVLRSRAELGPKLTIGTRAESRPRPIYWSALSSSPMKSPISRATSLRVFFRSAWFL
jgi:hypothetical protein